MTEAPLSPIASSLIFDELSEVTPDICLGPDVQPFVFGQESRRPAERLAGLERMGDKIARAIRPAIEPIARMRVGVSAEPLQIRSFQEWQDDQPEFSALTVYRLRPLKGGMLVQIHADFIAALVEIFYGGALDAKRARKAGDFTASEELLLNRVLEKIAAIFASHWNEVTPIELAFGVRETNVTHLPFVRGDEMVVVQPFALSAGNASSVISVLYPLAMLRPIEEKLEARVQDEDATASEDWRWKLGQALEQVKLPVRSVLARPEISVAELLALKPGDVIPITLPPRTPLLAGARRIADGVIGEQDGRAALLIEKVGNA
ncbi:MAG TPA: FliM/FliN family flagellar motor switch protein [Sphingomonas sp.]|nr:FliM/FliN family flagellar motor switch protein [Sphingomonas sp.]